MIKDYKELLKNTKDYLFPYSEVKKGSRIFIYGAGKLGEQLYNAVKGDTDYTIVGVADKNWQSYREQKKSFAKNMIILLLQLHM